MVYTNLGINEIQKIAIRNVAGITPNYFSFASINNTYTGSEIMIQEEYIRKAVTWTSNGITSKFTTVLPSTDCIGSNIRSVGLVEDIALGSGILFSVHPSFIADKNDTFNVQIEGEINIRRPV